MIILSLFESCIHYSFSIANSKSILEVSCMLGRKLVMLDAVLCVCSTFTWLAPSFALHPVCKCYVFADCFFVLSCFSFEPQIQWLNNIKLALARTTDGGCKPEKKNKVILKPDWIKLRSRSRLDFPPRSRTKKKRQTNTLKLNFPNVKCVSSTRENDVHGNLTHFATWRENWLTVHDPRKSSQQKSNKM